MVVLRPDIQAGERMSRCRGCGTIGLISPDRERASFLGYPKRAQCRRCDRSHRERDRALAERRLAGEAIGTFDQTARCRGCGVAISPRRGRGRPRAWCSTRCYEERRGRIAPEDRYQQPWERQLDEALGAERRGEIAVELRLSGSPRGGAMLPAGPFQRWLARLVVLAEREHPRDGREEGHTVGAMGAVAAVVGVDAATLRRYLRPREMVAEATVDHALSREGSLHILDLYPEIYG